MTTMKAIDIDNLLRYGEHLSMECKRADRDVPKSLWQTYSAFANSRGGFILLGVEENLDEDDWRRRFRVVGVRHAQQQLSVIWNTLNNPDKVSANVLPPDGVEIVPYAEGLELICIQVPAAPYQSRPVYLNGNPMHGSYRRNGEGDFRCTAEEVRAMMRDASSEGCDRRILPHSSMADIDADTLRRYRQLFRLQTPDHPWNDLDDQPFLMRLEAWRTDRDSGQSGLTAAGLLMFGTSLAFSDYFSHVRLDYLDKTRLLPGSRWSDRLTDDGTWEHNLLNFYSLVTTRLMRDLRRPFQTDGFRRVDETPVHMAVREAFTNLLIHADYQLTAAVLKVEKLDDGFLFSNPGSLLLPLEDIERGGHAKARNPLLQKMFRMIGLGENVGSGFPRILSAWRNENWRKPILLENDSLHLVELKLQMVSIFPPEATLFLRQQFRDRYDLLNAQEQIALVTAFMEGRITNAMLQPLFSELHPVEIGKLLAGLVDKGCLEKGGARRGTYYVLPPSLNDRDQEAADNVTSDKVATDNDDATGNDATGNDATGNDATDNDATGNDATDNDATGKVDGGNDATGKVDGGKVDGGNDATGKVDGGKVDGGNDATGKVDGGKVDGGKVDGGNDTTDNDDAAGNDADSEAPSRAGDDLDSRINNLLSWLGEDTVSSAELMRRGGHTHRGRFLVKYIQPALAAGLIEMTIPSKPNSRLQQYRRRRLGGVQEEARP